MSTKRNSNEKELLLALGRNIRQHRIQKNYTQTGFANILDKDQPYINRLENGRINPGYLILKAMSEALEIKLSELLLD